MDSLAKSPHLLARWWQEGQPAPTNRKTKAEAEMAGLRSSVWTQGVSDG